MTPVVRKSLRQVEVLYLDKRPAPCGVGDDFENRHELSPALLQTPVGKHGVPLEGFVVLEIPSRRKPRGPPAQAESGRDPADARALRSATNHAKHSGAALHKHMLDEQPRHAYSDESTSRISGRMTKLSSWPRDLVPRSIRQIQPKGI